MVIVNNTWNNIAKTLNNKHPLSIIVYNDPEDNSSIKDWLEGFVMAVACSASDWSLLLADAKNGYYLTIITNLDLAYSEDKALEERDVASLQFAVFKMHEFFLQFRDYDKQNLQSKNGFKSKIGRNNPCICGSGKKYKNCCIDITMH